MCIQPAASRGIFSVLLLLLPYASPMTFSFTGFQSDNPNITFQGDASAVSGIVQLTNGKPWSAGRAVFSRPVRLWDAATGEVTDFTTRFSFGIKASGDSFGDGITFFLTPKGSSMPKNSAGGYLGLFENSTDGAASSSAKLVAVEFDTKIDEWDPPYRHVGLDFNSIRSIYDANLSADLSSGSPLPFLALVSFNGSLKQFTLNLNYGNGSSIISLSLQHSADLATALSSEWVIVGFSAATSDAVESHEIYSWYFSSTLNTGEDGFTGPALAPSSSGGGGGEEVFTGGPALAPNSSQPAEQKKSVLSRPPIGVVVGVVAAVIAVGLIAWLIITRCRKRSAARRKKEGPPVVEMRSRVGGEGDASTTFQDMGLREFSFSELELATDNFNEERKLGSGSYGVVYLGRCGDLYRAIKSFKGEGQIVQESFEAEVKAIGRLGHRNLVPLVGWCIASPRQFFIVYDYMPNRSLDLHLFSNARTGQMAYPLLSWNKRYTVVLGLASALEYLHEEWVQCVVHRDIKPANVLLDEHFNARLGDFGLARNFEHDESMPSTEFVGTPAYMAPEVRRREHKHSKQSDVYSFGVVALNVATGRRASFPSTDAEGEEENLVTWVRRRHRHGGEDHLLGAADKRLRGDYEEGQMRCLMMVGLWCTLPDRSQRPTMSQVVQYLSFQAAVPELLSVTSEEPPRSDGAVPASRPPSMTNSIQHVGL